MGYYGTVFGLFLAMKKYSEDKEQSEKNREEREKAREKDREERKRVREEKLLEKQQEREEKLLEKQQEREQELIRIQEESNLLREKEIENRKDNYRPTFIINNNKIELLMRKEELYLENVIYYPNSNVNNLEYIGTIKSGTCIAEGTEEKTIPNNFYITAETILGEKILFGYVIGELKIYKYLKENGNPINPSGSKITDYNTIINNDWESYNFIENSDNRDRLLDCIEKIFFYKSRFIRLNIYLTNISLIKRFLRISNYAELYKNLFLELKLRSPIMLKYNMDSVIEIIDEIYNQIFSKDTLIINLFKIGNNKINYNKNVMESKIVSLKENVHQDKKYLIDKLKECKEFFEKSTIIDKSPELSLKKILYCIKDIEKYTSELPNSSKVKRELLDFCLTVLTIVFKNVEEVDKSEKYKANDSFLQHKTQILKKISKSKVRIRKQ